jgi:hypothetical protein
MANAPQPQNKKGPSTLTALRGERSKEYSSGGRTKCGGVLFPAVAKNLRLTGIKCHSEEL